MLSHVIAFPGSGSKAYPDCPAGAYNSINGEGQNLSRCGRRSPRVEQEPQRDQGKAEQDHRRRLRRGIDTQRSDPCFLLPGWIDPVTNKDQAIIRDGLDI